MTPRHRFTIAVTLLTLANACKHDSIPATSLKDVASTGASTQEIRPEASLGDESEWLATPVFQDKDLYAAIRKFSTDSGTPIPSITVEQVIALLPAEMHENYTLVYASKSLQGSSAANPRAILFMRNGTFVATFNGDAAQDGHERMEFLQYRVASRRYELGFLKFPLKAADIDPAANAFAKQDRSVCAGCHSSSDFNGGQVPRWGHYPDWPGIYGGYEDLLIDPANVQTRYIRRKGSCQAPLQFQNVTPDLAQSKQFFAAKPAWKTHPRYKYLFSSAESQIASWPFDLEYRGRFVNRPNLRFGSALQRNFIDSVMARLEADKAYYQSFRYMYLYGYAGCDAKNPSDPRLAELRTRAAAGRSSALATAQAPLTQLFVALAGVDPETMSFSPEPMKKPGFGYDEGFITSDQAIAARLIAALDAEGETLTRSFHFESLETCYPDYGDDYSRAEDQFGVEPKLYTPTFTMDNAISNEVADALGQEQEKNRTAVCAALEAKLWAQ